MQFELTGRLTAETALHVGGMGGDMDADLSLARDGQGRLCLPGTGLAGALRAVAEDRVPPAEHLFGTQAMASSLFISDAVLVGEESPETVTVREGNGIDRRRGAPAFRMKYNRAVVQAGTSFSFTIRGDLDAGDRTHIQAIAEQLASGRVRLGAAKTRGLGRVRLDGGEMTTWDTTTARGMLDWLAGRRVAGTKVAAAEAMAEFEMSWQPDGPLMSKAEIDGVVAKSLPLSTQVGRNLHLLLPGSAIKGSFRSFAERVVRTLMGLDAPNADRDSRLFIEQLKVPIVESLFGTTDSGGKLAFDDCRTVTAFPVDAEGPVLSGESGPLPASDLNLTHHVAIDRWTGGTAKGLLFTVLEPYGVRWEPIRLWVIADLSDLEKGLLRLCLQAFSRGQIPLGYSTQRGMGHVHRAANHDTHPMLASIAVKSAWSGHAWSAP